jgi:predicted esterase
MLPNMKRIRLCLFVSVVIFAFTVAARAEKAKPFVFIPTNGAGPFPVALWLHGYRGYSAEGYFPNETAAAMQKHADILGAAIIGFPATADLGDNTQQWSEEPVADHAYIQARLKEIAKTVNLDLSRVGLFGFSEGGMVAADLATLYPESYMGAILMSPGGIGAPRAAKVRTPAHEKQVYFCFCGADENPGNVTLTKAYANHLEKILGAKVTLKLYPGVSKHSRPPDFMEKFPLWMGAILRTSNTKQNE